MADLTVDRATPKRCIVGGISMPVQTAVKIPAGVMVGYNTGSSGYAISSAVGATGGVVVGVSKACCDNTTAGGGSAAAGAKEVELEWGVFEFDMSSPALTDVNKTAYMTDNHTVANSGTYKCGVIVRKSGAAKVEVMIHPLVVGL